MASQRGNQHSTKHSCIDDSITIFIDNLCIRCDREHTGPCPVKFAEWQQSLRFQILRGFDTFERIVHAVRRDRAILAMSPRR